MNRNVRITTAAIVMAVFAAVLGSAEPRHASPKIRLTQESTVNKKAAASSPAKSDLGEMRGERSECDTDTVREDRLSSTITPALSLASTSAFDDYLNDLDKRVSGQEELLDSALTRARYALAALVALFGLSIIYLWVRVARLSGERSREETSVDGEVESDIGQEEEGVLTVADAHSHEACRAPVTTTACGPICHGIPRVQFVSGVIDHLVAGINNSRQMHGDKEVGYALVGKIFGEGPSRVITVSGVIDEGPNAARSGSHHKADRCHQQRELELLQLVDLEAMHIGDAHLHPGNFDTCSVGDHRTDVANVRASRTQEMVFVIATAVSARWDERSSHALCRDGLKLDFFYLGKSSGYEYRRFRPEIAQAPALSLPRGLRSFAAADPVRVKLDFENLQRLSSYRMRVGDLTVEGQQAQMFVEMTHKSRKFKSMLVFSSDPRQRPEVLVEVDGQVVQFQPAYLNGGWTDAGVVWFTPLVLDVEREISGRHSGGKRGNNSETSTGVRSAPAEKETPGPIGGNHGKLSTVK